LTVPHKIQLRKYCSLLLFACFLFFCFVLLVCFVVCLFVVHHPHFVHFFCCFVSTHFPPGTIQWSTNTCSLRSLSLLFLSPFSSFLTLSSLFPFLSSLSSLFFLSSSFSSSFSSPFSFFLPNSRFQETKLRVSRGGRKQTRK